MKEGADIGSYRVLARLGSGGMGEVWLAEHVTLGRRAAIKLLRPDMSTREDVVARFFNEARAAAAINDPGVVQVFEVRQHEDGRGYIVMELLDGEPLDRRLSRGPLAVADAIRIMRQVATSLAAAHARGIVHRDLKPENIFLARDSEVAGGERAKLLDFGIAKLSETTGAKTQTAAVMGTPTYMSPEQCRGAGQVDARSDIYSLGCVLFQLVTGRPPFDADGVGEIIAMHLREIAPRASSVAPHIPRALDDLIARCLAKSPEQRVASATALASELDALGKTSTAVPETFAPAALPHSIPTTLSSMAMEVPRPRGRQRLFLGLVAVMAVGTVVTVAAVRANSGGSEEGVGSGSAFVAVTPPPIAPPSSLQPAAIDELLAASVRWVFGPPEAVAPPPVPPIAIPAPKKPSPFKKKPAPAPAPAIDCFTHRC